MQKTIVWLRQDLRILDNPALFYAAQKGAVYPIYIYDTQRPLPIGGASHWWLHHSLASLQESFSKDDCSLHFFKGNPLFILMHLCQKHSINHVYWNRCYEPYAIKRDSHIKKALRELNITVESFYGSLLFEPWTIKNKSSSFFKVFTPFWKHCLSLPFKDPLPKPTHLSHVILHNENMQVSLEDLLLLPKNPNWAKEWNKYWVPGEQHALKKLQGFLKNSLNIYAEKRNYPSANATSYLSAPLHFGEISPRFIHHQALKKVADSDPNIQRFLAELGWREFSYHLLYHFPDLPVQPFQEKFQHFPWHYDATTFNAWTKGQTGCPIVDAGMRQLWNTGYMHNRVRMITASFLTKHLLIPWQKGAEWFWDTLVDADLANNSASWQWVAGSGADAAPYFRIFNPVLQGKKFDPDGRYTRKWVPELCSLPNAYLQNPWEASSAVLKKANVILGKTYPNLLVDLNIGRKRALEAYKIL